jgi:rhodanese-related sulfurtransferase
MSGIFYENVDAYIAFNCLSPAVESCVFLDLRSSEEYNRSHITHAHCVPIGPILSELSDDEVNPRITQLIRALPSAYVFL